VESLRGEKKAKSVFMVVLDVVALYQIGLAVDLYFKKPVRKISVENEKRQKKAGTKKAKRKKPKPTKQSKEVQTEVFVHVEY
jgi:hypothetical protein